MVKLSVLPNEVLLNIAQFLICSRTTLHALALCSRRFHRISQELLYHSVSVYTTRDILLLARTLLHRPDLAKTVQELETDVSGDDRNYNLTKDVEKQFETVLRQSCQFVPITDQWFTDIWSNTGGASVALLLLLLPNVRKIDIQIWPFSEHLANLMHIATFGHSYIVAPATHRCRPLSQLLDLRLTMNSFSSIQLSSIMDLPTLRSLSVESFSTLRYPWSFDKAFSRIHSLQLTRCELNEVELFNFLRACRELRELQYHWHRPWSDEDVIDDDDWDWKNDIGPWVIAGLQQSRGTLEVLEITGDRPMRHDALSLGSLTAFTCLQVLRVPAVMVLNPTCPFLSQQTLEHLPDSLRHLHLIDAEIVGEERLESMLLERLHLEDSFPSLAKITVTWQQEVWFMVPRFNTPIFQHLRRLCSDHKISYVLEML